MCPLRLALTLACSIPLAPLSAQDVPPAEDQASPGEIIVEGNRYSPEETARRLAIEVTKHAPTGTPVARFSDAACFGTAGLPTAMGQALVNRMMDNALAVGATVAPDGCKPNILVLFMDDAPAELKRLRKTDGRLFESIPNDEMRAVTRSVGPVQVLNTVETRGKDGDSLRPGDPPELKLRSPTRIDLPIRLDLIGSVVIIARSAVPGRSINQLADYATMRALARTRDAEADSDGTILSLFTAPTPPAGGMTAFDRSYLRALFTAPANGYASSTMAAVGREYAARCGEGQADTRCE